MSERHPNNIKEFRELAFAEREKSITATINNLRAAMEDHIEHSPRRQDAIEECLDQIAQLQEGLRARYVPIATTLPSGQTASAHPSLHASKSLEQLLEGVKDANIHQEVDTGPAVGEEVW
jgi:hypothetical protein